MLRQASRIIWRPFFRTIFRRQSIVVPIVIPIVIAVIIPIVIAVIIAIIVTVIIAIIVTVIIAIIVTVIIIPVIPTPSTITRTNKIFIDLPNFNASDLIPRVGSLPFLLDQITRLSIINRFERTSVPRRFHFCLCRSILDLNT